MNNTTYSLDELELYKSPIEAICSEVTHEILKDEEDRAMLAIQQAVGYKVDKDELIKALRYDRNQYEKGYNDAVDNLQKTGKWTIVPIGGYMLLHRCSNCSRHSVINSKYCPNCGAKMEVEDE